MPRITPPIDASGLFVLLPPFTTIPGVTYTVKAIRTFDDIYRLNVDVFKNYYEPKGLSEAIFNADVAAGALMITLMANEIGLELSPSDPNTIIYVPDTYISHFPDGNDVPYSHIVLSASLGALPDYLDLSDIMSQIGTDISEKIGVTPIVNINKAKLNGVVPTADHIAFEIGREAAITNRNTKYTQYYDLDVKYQALKDQYDTLEASYISLAAVNGEDTQYLDSIGYYTIDLANDTSNDTIYIDNNFFNKIKLTMDLSAHPDNPYIEVSGTNPLNGTAASVDGDGNLIFNVDRSLISGAGATFLIRVKDENDIIVDNFTINIIYINLATPMLFGDTVLNFDLTLPGPYRQRIFFNTFTRTQRVLLDEVVINDPFDPDEMYFELSGLQTGVSFVYGKNFIEFTVDDSLFIGNIDTHVNIPFIRRTTDSNNVNTDVAGIYDIHITNTL